MLRLGRSTDRSETQQSSVPGVLDGGEEPLVRPVHGVHHPAPVAVVAMSSLQMLVLSCQSPLPCLLPGGGTREPRLTSAGGGGSRSGP